jgi:ribosomal protein S18 acetylase RimI-like enzyme
LILAEVLTPIQVRPLESADADWVRQLLAEHWHSAKIVSRGKVHYADRLPGLIAMQDDRRVGLVTFHVEGDECEIVTLNSLAEGIGVGSALISGIRSAAISNNCRRVWLITTNDNTPALRFYQQRGFTLAAFHRNALQLSRKLKPEIQLVGLDGIPLRDELELEMLL